MISYLKVMDMSKSLKKVFPFVFTKGSPTNKLTPFLTNILKPLILNSEFSIENYFELVKRFKNDNFTISNENIFVSIVVVSPFTNTAVDLSRYYW